MNVPRFLRAAVLVALAAAAPAALHAAGLAAGRPTIVYIMSDDHAAPAIGADGGRLAKLNPTPAIDRLAREGMAHMENPAHVGLRPTTPELIYFSLLPFLPYPALLHPTTTDRTRP